MCGFIVRDRDRLYNDSKVKLRGQDQTSKMQHNDIVFQHYLLSVTGKYLPQPFFDDSGDIICVYNGEIYNYPYKVSDGENLIPLYKEYGSDFISMLDGEFAIVLYDFKNDLVILATDAFGTKPLWEDGTAVASYKSALGNKATKVGPNLVVIKRLSNGEIQDFYQPFCFDFNSQTIGTYDYWIGAFEAAIEKRQKDRGFLGLSSGYDSGGIACALENNEVDFKAFSLYGTENREILEQRLGRIDHNIIYYDTTAVIHYRNRLERYVEPALYKILIDDKTWTETQMFNDPAAVGLSFICQQGQAEKRKVYLSGQGADEILADYSLCPWQSKYKGVFPDRLEEWPNFYHSCQSSYLSKEEHVAGSFNIETRYPYLDVDLVQEFLWLTPELKNKHYKAPLREYLIRNNYPFEEGKKRGFSI